MTHADLFAGIGGFSLAAQWAGIENIWSNEIDPFCCAVLRKNFKHRIIEDDIRNIGRHNLETVDIISGGFPCQPYSNSGKRKGKEDSRDGWPENFRIIKELRPPWYIGENVTGIINLALEQILFDLESIGYISEVFIMPAYAVGAAHKRERIWICSHSEEIRRTRLLCPLPATGYQSPEGYSKERITLGTRCNPFLQFEKSVGESPIFGMDDGIPDRVDRLGACGNAIVPQVAFEIFKAIKKIESL